MISHWWSCAFNIKRVAEQHWEKTWPIFCPPETQIDIFLYSTPPPPNSVTTHIKGPEHRGVETIWLISCPLVSCHVNSGEVNLCAHPGAGRVEASWDNTLSPGTRLAEEVCLCLSPFHVAHDRVTDMTLLYVWTDKTPHYLVGILTLRYRSIAMASRARIELCVSTSTVHATRRQL